MASHDSHPNGSGVSYQPPMTEVIGSIRALTQQKAGEDPDGFKGEGDVQFPSRFPIPEE